MGEPDCSEVIEKLKKRNDIYAICTYIEIIQKYLNFDHSRVSLPMSMCVCVCVCVCVSICKYVDGEEMIDSYDSKLYRWIKR